MKLKLKFQYILLILLGIIIKGTNAAEHPQLKAFAQESSGMQRVVIVLPHKERGEEDAFKVELLPGK